MSRVIALVGAESTGKTTLAGELRDALGDRSCLALAKLRDASVLTADRPWERIAGATGLTITCCADGGNHDAWRA